MRFRSPAPSGLAAAECERFTVRPRPSNDEPAARHSQLATPFGSHITQAARESCIQSNQPATLYHQNWKVYAKRVECPAAITQVTGCKLVEDLPRPDPSITVDNALANGFVDGYHTTSMEDCAKPTCAARDWVTGNNAGTPHATEGLYNSFYTCNESGVPWTAPE